MTDNEKELLIAKASLVGTDAQNPEKNLVEYVEKLIEEKKEAIEEVVGIVEGMKRKYYNEQQPFLKHRNDFNDAYNAVITDIIATLQKINNN